MIRRSSHPHPSRPWFKHKTRSARIEFADIDKSFLEMVGTNVTYEPDDLHPAAAADAAKIGAGLFQRPRNGAAADACESGS